MRKTPGRRLETEAGFTIVETVIAIAIFSFLIIFCLGMFIFVGRIYYRGLYEGRVQEISRGIVGNVSESLRFSGQDVREYVPDLTAAGYEGWQAYCIGGVQYSFKENIQLITESAPGDRQSEEVFILTDACNEDLADSAPPPPCPTPPTGILCAQQRVELLHENMRLLGFSVEPLGDGLYGVEVKIALGGDMSDLEFDRTVFKYVDWPADPAVEVDPTAASFASQTGWRAAGAVVPAGPSNPADYYNNLRIVQCQSGETFCALIDFKTKAFRRVF